MISLEAFSRLVGVIYDAASASDWEEVLRSLAQATGASVGGLVVDGNGHVPDIARTVGANPDALDSYKRYYHAIDPVIPALLRKATGAVITQSMLIPRAEMARTKFYNDWLRPQEIDDCLATTIMNECQPGILVFAVPTRVGNFNADAVRLVKLLAPHLQAAFRAHKHLYGVALQRDGALEALDRLGRPVLFTDGSGRFSLANSAAERLLAEADGLMTGSNGMLHAATRQQTTELHRLIAVAGGLADGYRHGGSMLIDRPSGEKPLLVTVIPLPPDGHAVLPRHDTGVLVLIAAPTDDVPVPARALQALFGLTPTEAKVAQAITRGKGLKAAANTLGIAPSTAKTHLLRVFAKTGTTRQAELVDRLGHLVTAPIER